MYRLEIQIPYSYNIIWVPDKQLLLLKSWSKKLKYRVEVKVEEKSRRKSRSKK